MGAELTVVIAGGLALWMVSRWKKTPLLLAALPSVVGAIALLVGLPDLLFEDEIKLAHPTFWIIFLLGIVIALLPMVIKSVPNALLIVGITLATWALFRAMPEISIAFQHLGENLSKTGADFARDITA